MKYSIYILVCLGLIGCDKKPANPPAEGFNVTASDKKAILVADEVMEAMGGRKAWDETKILAWNFFGNRHLVWDKQTGDLRIDSARDSMVYLMNLKTVEGRILRGDEEITHTDSLSKYLDRAKAIWINDSYWMLMPFKLKDSGVTLKYLREESDQKGNPSDVLQLTFEEVGRTPGNRYEIWVNKDPRLVMQWAFYRDADQGEPNYVRPWDNYQPYDGILISADRSDDSGPRSVQVFDSLPGSVFTDWERPALVNLD